MTTTIEEQNNEPEIAKAKYKALRFFQVSKEWVSLVEAYNMKAIALLGEVKKNIETRKKADISFTELDKLLSYIKFIEQLISLLPTSEGGEIFKKELQEQIERGLSHVYGKVEVGFDTPMYSKADMIKNEYNAALTIGRKLEEIISQYEPKKEESSSLHPYEEI